MTAESMSLMQDSDWRKFQEDVFQYCKDSLNGEYRLQLLENGIDIDWHQWLPPCNPEAAMDFAHVLATCVVEHGEPMNVPNNAATQWFQHHPLVLDREWSRVSRQYLAKLLLQCQTRLVLGNIIETKRRWTSDLVNEYLSPLKLLGDEGEPTLWLFDHWNSLGVDHTNGIADFSLHPLAYLYHLGADEVRVTLIDVENGNFFEDSVQNSVNVERGGHWCLPVLVHFHEERFERKLAVGPRGHVCRVYRLPD